MPGEPTVPTSGSAELIPYGDVRTSVQNGDVILFRGRNLISRIIRRVTRSPYSHAGIAAWWNERLIVLEAIGSGVVARPLSRVVKMYAGKAELWTTHVELDRDKVVSIAKTELGKHYATTLLFRILRKVTIGLRKDPDPWRPPDRFICSQYVSYAWRAGGVDLAGDEPDAFTTPAHIARSRIMRKVGTLCVGGGKEPSSEEPSQVEIVPPADSDDADE